MSHEVYGTQTLSPFTDKESGETIYSTDTLYHGNGYPPNGPCNSSSCGNRSIDYLQQPCETKPSTQAIKVGCQLDNQPQFPSPFLVYQTTGFEEIYNPHKFSGTYAKDSQRFTCYVSDSRCIIHFPKVPRHGDIFCSQRFDNVLLLNIVSTESPRDHHSLSLSGSPKDRDLYRVCLEDDITSLVRMGGENLTFHEENRTATYYLPDKDIALHFTRVPRDGDIFCSRRNDNVVVLESTESSQEHHNMLLRDKFLYRAHEGNGDFLLLKMDNNNINFEESYFFGGATQEENCTFTYYLPDKDMVCHFNRLPTHRDLFDSYRKNNIMILDVASLDKDQEIRSYGSPWDADLYRVQQREDGFELMMVTYEAKGYSCEDDMQRRLKIRRYIASNTSPDMCALCLVAYKDFDRIGSLDPGPGYHVKCLVRWLLRNGYCTLCKKLWKSKNLLVLGF